MMLREFDKLASILRDWLVFELVEAVLVEKAAEAPGSGRGRNFFWQAGGTFDDNADRNNNRNVRIVSDEDQAKTTVSNNQLKEARHGIW